MVSNVGVQQLENHLAEVKAQQGIVGKLWNGVKEAFKTGTRETQCESMVEDFKQGKISFDEAIDYINNFEEKQKNATNLISNIASGVGSIAIATTAAASGPIGWGLAIAKGAPIGAAIKTGLNTLDRATNDVEGDALDGKELIKDVVTGATTGATSAVSSGIFQGVKQAKFGLTVAKGLGCGAICGAVSGAIDYTTNTALDDNIQFKFGDLTKRTATSALISGGVGAIVGSGVYGFEGLAGHIGKETALSTTGTIVRDSALSSTRKVLGQETKHLVHAM